jgi:hypothetical protein
MTKTEKLKLCVGCRDNFYNGNNELGVSECWLLKTAKPVTRYRLGYWTRPSSRKDFEKVGTLDCHRPPGYVHMKELPAHIRAMPEE